jgi:hypothetical protein
MTEAHDLPRTRSCGCIWHDDSRHPTFSCRDAVALQASSRLAEMLAAGSPGDGLCRKLVAVTQAALDRHYGAHGRAPIKAFGRRLIAVVGDEAPPLGRSQ